MLCVYKEALRTYVKIAISEKKELLCELVGKKPKNLDACEECQLYVQTWVTLRCDHKVCNECFNESASYICSKDKQRTTKDKARRENCNKLRNSRVYCPACTEEHTCTNITNHISCKHPELLKNADESVGPPHTKAMARSETEPRRGEEKREPLWDNPPQACDAPATHTGSDSNFDVDMEHEERCSDRDVQCPFCSKEMAFNTLQRHINTTCPARKGEQSGDTSRTHMSQDYIEVSKKILNVPADVQEVKEQMQVPITRGSVRDVLCPLCEKKVSNKEVTRHLSDTCELRLQQCQHCGLDIEACHLEDHMGNCDERPATCEHCNGQFTTFAEMRDDHLEVCPLRPLRCPYSLLGCNFQEVYKDMKEHTGSCKYLTSFVDRFVALEKEVMEIRNENKELRKIISEKEAELGKVESGCKRIESDVRARLQDLEERHAIYEEPLGKLLAEMATMK